MCKSIYLDSGCPDPTPLKPHLIEANVCSCFRRFCKRLNLFAMSGSCYVQEAVIKGGGHIFLLTCLRENISKEAAAQGLLRLLKDNTKTRGDVLQAGFVTIAVDSVDQRFASTDIALGLVDVCSTSEGMDQIYASKKAVQALLSILEHCPTMEGKGAAAAVIARLYPRLNRNEDLNRQIEMTAACPHLIRYLELEDKSQLQMFLKALAAFATGRRGRQMIHEERGPKPLINYLKNKQFDNEVREPQCIPNSFEVTTFDSAFIYFESGVAKLCWLLVERLQK